MSLVRDACFESPEICELTASSKYGEQYRTCFGEFTIGRVSCILYVILSNALLRIDRSISPLQKIRNGAAKRTRIDPLLNVEQYSRKLLRNGRRNDMRAQRAQEKTVGNNVKIVALGRKMVGISGSLDATVQSVRSPIKGLPVNIGSISVYDAAARRNGGRELRLRVCRLRYSPMSLIRKALLRHLDLLRIQLIG